jgi:antitoxin FitA
MAQLIVRDLPAELVLALERRAAKRNRSAEQEHREILKAALKSTKRRPLAAVLAAFRMWVRTVTFGVSKAIAGGNFCISWIPM